LEKRVPGLDGIRALCAIAVALLHLGDFPLGWIGVQFFYVLSGFLITKILLDSQLVAASRTAMLKRFYYRRCLRIFPLYYFYLLVFAIAAFGFHSYHAQGHLLPYMATYTYNIERAFTPPERFGLSTHLWSLAVEEQFYLVWPLLVILFTRRHFRAFGLFAMFLSPILHLMLLNNPHAPRLVYFLTPFQLGAFAIGAVLSTLSVREMMFIRKPYYVLIVILVAFALFLNRHLPLFGFELHMASGHKTWLWGYGLINLCAGALVVACCTRAFIVPYLEWAPLRYLGRISYGFYVWHAATLLIVMRVSHKFGFAGGDRWDWLQFACFLALNTLIATISYRVIELPFLRYKDRHLKAVRPAEVSSVVTSTAA
jgi:peptidoglycan/LPS O-acetylase OafA/YrhL